VGALEGAWRADSRCTSGPSPESSRDRQSPHCTQRTRGAALYSRQKQETRLTLSATMRRHEEEEDQKLSGLQ
jgi:hypothetical protein